MKGITLIGMPGAGKSTIGKILAERLNYKFIDLDDLIKEKTGRSHADILEKDGATRLLQLENQYTLDLDLSRTIFSPGGSIIYSPEAMERLQNETTVIYLALPFEEIRRRLGDGAMARGVVGLQEKKLDGLFAERDPIYQKEAHHSLNCLGLSEEAIIEKILQL